MIIKEYFPDNEISCKCGCGLMPDAESVERLYAVRMIYRKPMIITSGARCETHNYNVGGSKNSKHLVGAFDVKVPPEDEWEFIRIAQFCGFNGIGVNNNKFIHIDDKHEQPTVWTY